MLLSIKEASDFLGVSISTLRRWEEEKRLIPEKTAGGHRRYDRDKLIRFKNKEDGNRITIAYARVSSSDQKEDFERQKDSLSNYCAARGYQFRVISDLGSGLNYTKKGLSELIELICNNEIERIVINYKDRLIRYGYELIEQVCLHHDVKIEIVNFTEDKTYEQELVEDMLSIITVFSSRLYGSRSHKIKKLRDEFNKILKEINKDDNQPED